LGAWGFWLYIVAAAGFVAVASASDLTVHRVPNFLTVPAALIGLICAVIHEWFPAALPGYPVGFWYCLAGFGVGFGLFFLPFALGGGGAGDVKLAAALGALLGLYMFLAALLAALIFASIIAVVIWMVGLSGSGKPRGKARRRRAVTFAVPTALGTWCLLGVVVYCRYHPEILAPPHHSAPVQDSGQGH
jgi:Flp pilus assembly protein protease CpaA